MRGFKNPMNGRHGVHHTNQTRVRIPRALFATAVAQALVPLSLMIWVPAIDFSPGVVPVLGLNAFWRTSRNRR